MAAPENQGATSVRTSHITLNNQVSAHIYREWDGGNYIIINAGVGETSHRCDISLKSSEFTALADFVNAYFGDE